MDDDHQVLLDTPKKLSLQRQSTDTRAILKEFERTFAAENGRKPQQIDIKSNLNISNKYKEYHKIQDVLAGRLSFEKFNTAQPTASVRTRRHTRTDSGLGLSPAKHNHVVHATPKKSKQAYKTEPFEETLNSPNPQLLSIIGPTPHRDGKVLGLFDLMSNAGSADGTAATPSSSARKRKIDQLYEMTPAKRHPLTAIQTPSHQSPSKRKGDLLDFLAGTPEKSARPSLGKYSRTPQSEGRKFELSQFFATPSTQRFLFPGSSAIQKEAETRTTQEKKQTPQRLPDTTGLDATPAYLRRSTSFKDRLLSASQGPATSGSSSSLNKIGPPTLQHFRSSTSNVLKASEVQSPKNPHNVDDYDDDLEALYEFEADDHGRDAPVQEVQQGLTQSECLRAEANEPSRQYRKKGQKRTTRRANIKPTTQKSIAQPVFVAPDEANTGKQTEAANNDLKRTGSLVPTVDDFDDEFELEDAYDSDLSAELRKNGKEVDNSGRGDTKTKAKKKAGTINPNAQSHTNYRSLKIKNKNSKAKGAGRSRFVRGRR